MLRLYVMRHAKSSWAAPGARDFDRELNERGVLDLEKISARIAASGYVPELILCSAAVRTRLTLEGIKTALTPKPEIIYTEKLYSSGMEDYLRMINEVEDFKSVMIIGHNPMSGALASTLAGHGDSEMIEKIAFKYPTSTIAVLDFDLEQWSAVHAQSGKLIDLIIPSEL